MHDVPRMPSTVWALRTPPCVWSVSKVSLLRVRGEAIAVEGEGLRTMYLGRHQGHEGREPHYKVESAVLTLRHAFMQNA